MVSVGALCAFSLVPAVIGSDFLYDSCGASGTSVDASISVLGDCYASGLISSPPAVAQGILVMPKVVDSLERPMGWVVSCRLITTDTSLLGWGELCVGYSERGF